MIIGTTRPELERYKLLAASGVSFSTTDVWDVDNESYMFNGSTFYLVPNPDRGSRENRVDPTTLGASAGEGDAQRSVLGALAKRPWLSKVWNLDLTTLANALQRTFHYHTVLEAAPALVRIGVFNNTLSALAGMRVAIASGLFVGNDSSVISIDPAAADGSWQDCNFAETLRFTARLNAATSGTLQVAWTGPTGTYSVLFVDTVLEASGAMRTVRQQRQVALTNLQTTATWTGAITSSDLAVAATPTGTFRAGNGLFTVDNPGLSWTDWTVYPNAGRRSTDRLGLTPIHVRIETPATNTLLPVYKRLNTQGWESYDAVGGRIWRMRSQAVAGVTNKSAFTSTAFEPQCLPIAIQYIPRDGVRGFTAAALGDAVVDGTGANVPGFGWLQRAQREASTPSAPIEIASLALTNP